MKKNNKSKNFKFKNNRKSKIDKLKKMDKMPNLKKKNNKFKSIKLEVNKISKKNNKKGEKKDGNIARKKRMRTELVILSVIFLALLIRIGYIQFYRGEELKSMAYVQQTLDRKINPKRGTIYDATGKNILAVSSTVQTVTVNPVNISL